MGEYWYNLETGAVEEGMQADALRRMGPYSTKEEAAEALARASARNEQWDDEDKAWDTWGEDDAASAE